MRTHVRKSLFDSLHTELDGTHFLDLFAGSGSFGLEALSRGASHATFVEAGREGIRCLERNLATLKLGSEEALLLPARLPEVLHTPSPRFAPYDFVTMDPPFAISRTAEGLPELLEGLTRAGALGWWRPGTRLLWEEPSDAFDPAPVGFREIDRRSYGTSRIRRFVWDA